MNRLTAFILTIVLIFLAACATKTDSVADRFYHQTTSKYNILFNGREALKDGVEDLNNNYNDDFQAILPVEPLAIKEDHQTNTNEKPSKGSRTVFDIAEDKAVKTVQKHSMSINSKERNNQIDDAYFLLGQARYYSQRFVPALEAFNFILDEFPETKLKKQVEIWKAKTLIRMQTESLGIKTINELINNEDLNNKMLEEAHTALAMGYQSMDQQEKMMEHLKEAVMFSDNKELEARNTFILGQLYEASGKRDSATMAYQTLIELNRIPQKYKVNAYLKLATLDEDSNQTAYYIKQLKRMLKNPLSKNFYDEIYYGLAAMSFNEGKDEKAIAYLNKSLNVESADALQKLKSYQRLGDYYFDKSKFVKAGVYYDSLVPFIDNPNKKTNRELLRKQKTLKDVVFYEGIVAYNDSILSLVAMDVPARKEFFSDIIKRQKEADALAKGKQEKKKFSFGLPGFGTGTKKNSLNDKVWYFYNPQAVGFGQAEFIKVWGDRPLKDNWRWSQESISDSNSLSDFDTENNTEEAPKDLYNLDYYMSSVPSNPEIIEKYRQEKSEANYQLGLIYKEKLKDMALAQNRLEIFLKESPLPNKVLPAKYHLYRVYQATNNPKAEALFNDIVQNNPQSRYALLLQDKIVDGNHSEVTPDEDYANVYKLYQNKQYQKTIEQCNDGILTYKNTAIHPKFELLKSYAQYYAEGEEQFIKGLEYIIFNFPQSSEAVHARSVLEKINSTSQALQHQDKSKTEKEKREKVLEMMKNHTPREK